MTKDGLVKVDVEKVAKVLVDQDLERLDQGRYARFTDRNSGRRFYAHLGKAVSKLDLSGFELAGFKELSGRIQELGAKKYGAVKERLLFMGDEASALADLRTAVGLMRQIPMPTEFVGGQIGPGPKVVVQERKPRVGPKTKEAIADFARKPLPPLVQPLASASRSSELPKVKKLNTKQLAKKIEKPVIIASAAVAEKLAPKKVGRKEAK